MTEPTNHCPARADAPPDHTPTATPGQEQPARSDATVLRKAITATYRVPGVPTWLCHLLADVLAAATVDATNGPGADHRTVTLARALLDPPAVDESAPVDELRQAWARIHTLRTVLDRIAYQESTPCSDIARVALRIDGNPPPAVVTEERVEQLAATLRMTLAPVVDAQREARNLGAYVYLISKATSLAEARRLAQAAVDAPCRAPGVVERLEAENDALRGNVGRLEWTVNRVRDAVAAMDPGVDAVALRAALELPHPDSLPGIHAGANPMRVTASTPDGGPLEIVPSAGLGDSGPPEVMLRFDAGRLSRADGVPVEVLAEHARFVGGAAESLRREVPTDSNSKEI